MTREPGEQHGSGDVADHLARTHCRDDRILSHEPRHRIVDKRNAHHVPHKDEQRHESEQEREINASKLLSVSKRDGHNDDSKHYAHIDDSRNCEQADAE